MRRPFKKETATIPMEEAHGGSGLRQMLLTEKDPISSHLRAMAKGYLPAGNAYDWHGHEGIDEFWLVLKGTGRVEYKNGDGFDYKPGDLIYNPADLDHRIENTSGETSEFYFIRLDA